MTCPTNSSTFPIDLSAACHHLDIFLIEVRGDTEFTCSSTIHASIYAALLFCVLKCACSNRKQHLNMLMLIIQFIIDPHPSDRTESARKMRRRLSAKIITDNSPSNLTECGIPSEVTVVSSITLNAQIELFFRITIFYLVFVAFIYSFQHL
jgi:hypothetical protein